MDRPDFSDIDPALDDCCRREEESNRRRSVLETTLSRHDVTLLAERRRRHLVQNLSWGIGCRCCYDPHSDGGEYRALMELRERMNQENCEKEEEDEALEQKSTDTASDSDDEFDYLLNEDLPGDDGIKAMEERRRAELELAMLHREVALQHGYGAHRQMHPSRALRAAGLGETRSPAPAVVLHLFDPDSTASASMDLYLERVAETRYKGTKFMRSDGRATLMMDADMAKRVLPRLRPEADMPTLVCVRDGVVVNVCPNLQGLVDDGPDSELEIVPEAVREWLDRAGVLLENPPPFEEVCLVRPEEEALYDHMAAAKAVEPPRYDCGVPSCQKTFPHEHVGVQNEKQDGLIVQEEQVLGDETSNK
jgi:hypothetical protein